MTNIQKKAARAEIVADIEEYLSNKAQYMRQEAKDDLENCPMDECGNYDKENWRWVSAQQKSDKADMIEAVIKDLEKF